MRLRRIGSSTSILRQVFTGAVFCVGLSIGPTYAGALLPEGYFDTLPPATDAEAAVEADNLTYHAEQNLIVASGHVQVSYAGYKATADRLIFNQNTRDLELIGNVVIVDPQGTEYATNHLVATGQFRKAILDSLVMVTPNGAKVTATAVDYNADTITHLDDGTYAPCGDCIDEKGRRIGWRVRTTGVTYRENEEVVDLENPVLELWGYPVAWLPWMRMPDPSNPRANGFRLPSFGYSEEIGLKVEFPYFYAVNNDIGLTFTPTLVSRQGGLLGARFDHQVGTLGSYYIGGSGLYQLDRSAFAGEAGDRDWRGAIQTAGRFTPVEDWTVGWSYTAFTDANYLKNYQIDTADVQTNEVYAQYLTSNTYADLRLQEFKVQSTSFTAAGEIAAQNQQGAAVPKARYENVLELGEDHGRLSISSRLLGVTRAADATATSGGVPYVFGHAGNKAHAVTELGWTNQWIAPGGVALTPYLGARADYAWYDGGSALMPAASDLFSLTPIAALDIRYPLMAVGGGATHMVEPIAQIVYRGNSTTAVGITNDDAQGYLLDEANVFSFNHFAGADRQDTGLRANVGGHYLASFDNGTSIDFIAGQSFHLAGTNAQAISDAAQAGTSTGLGTTASYLVAGVRADFASGLQLGAKTQFDPNTTRLTRAALGGSYAHGGWAVSADYAFTAADGALGLAVDRQDIGGAVTIPLADYWSARLGAGYDITNAQFIDHSALLKYDDGYLEVGLHYDADGALFSPTNQTYKLSFKLKTPDGSSYGL